MRTSASMAYMKGPLKCFLIYLSSYTLLLPSVPISSLMAQEQVQVQTINESSLEKPATLTSEDINLIKFLEASSTYLRHLTTLTTYIEGERSKNTSADGYFKDYKIDDHITRARELFYQLKAIISKDKNEMRTLKIVQFYLNSIIRPLKRILPATLVGVSFDNQNGDATTSLQVINELLPTISLPENAPPFAVQYFLNIESSESESNYSKWYPYVQQCIAQQTDAEISKRAFLRLVLSRQDFKELFLICTRQVLGSMAENLWNQTELLAKEYKNAEESKSLFLQLASDPTDLFFAPVLAPNTESSLSRDYFVFEDGDLISAKAEDGNMHPIRLHHQKSLIEDALSLLKFSPDGQNSKDGDKPTTHQMLRSVQWFTLSHYLGELETVAKLRLSGSTNKIELPQSCRKDQLLAAPLPDAFSMGKNWTKEHSRNFSRAFLAQLELSGAEIFNPVPGNETQRGTAHFRNWRNPDYPLDNLSEHRNFVSNYRNYVAPALWLDEYRAIKRANKDLKNKPLEVSILEEHFPELAQTALKNIRIPLTGGYFFGIPWGDPTLSSTFSRQLMQFPTPYYLNGQNPPSVSKYMEIAPFFKSQLANYSGFESLLNWEFQVMEQLQVQLTAVQNHLASTKRDTTGTQLAQEVSDIIPGSIQDYRTNIEFSENTQKLVSISEPLKELVNHLASRINFSDSGLKHFIKKMEFLQSNNRFDITINYYDLNQLKKLSRDNQNLEIREADGTPISGAYEANEYVMNNYLKYIDWILYKNMDHFHDIISKKNSFNNASAALKNSTYSSKLTDFIVNGGLDGFVQSFVINNFPLKLPSLMWEIFLEQYLNASNQIQFKNHLQSFLKMEDWENTPLIPDEIRRKLQSHPIRPAFAPLWSSPSNRFDSLSLLATAVANLSPTTKEKTIKVIRNSCRRNPNASLCVENDKNPESILSWINANLENFMEIEQPEDAPLWNFLTASKFHTPSAFFESNHQLLQAVYDAVEIPHFSEWDFLHDKISTEATKELMIVDSIPPHFAWARLTYLLWEHHYRDQISKEADDANYIKKFAQELNLDRPYNPYLLGSLYRPETKNAVHENRLKHFRSKTLHLFEDGEKFYDHIVSIYNAPLAQLNSSSAMMPLVGDPNEEFDPVIEADLKTWKNSPEYQSLQELQQLEKTLTEDLDEKGVQQLEAILAKLNEHESKTPGEIYFEISEEGRLIWMQQLLKNLADVRVAKILREMDVLCSAELDYNYRERKYLLYHRLEGGNINSIKGFIAGNLNKSKELFAMANISPVANKWWDQLLDTSSDEEIKFDAASLHASFTPAFLGMLATASVSPWLMVPLLIYGAHYTVTKARRVFAYDDSIRDDFKEQRNRYQGLIKEGIGDIEAMNSHLTRGNFNIAMEIIGGGTVIGGLTVVLMRTIALGLIGTRTLFTQGVKFTLKWAITKPGNAGEILQLQHGLSLFPSFRRIIKNSPTNIKPPAPTASFFEKAFFHVIKRPFYNLLEITKGEMPFQSSLKELEQTAIQEFKILYPKADMLKGQVNRNGRLNLAKGYGGLRYKNLAEAEKIAAQRIEEGKKLPLSLKKYLAHERMTNAIQTLNDSNFDQWLIDNFNTLVEYSLYKYHRGPQWIGYVMRQGFPPVPAVRSVPGISHLHRPIYFNDWGRLVELSRGKIMEASFQADGVLKFKGAGMDGLTIGDAVMKLLTEKGINADPFRKLLAKKLNMKVKDFNLMQGNKPNELRKLLDQLKPEQIFSANSGPVHLSTSTLLRSLDDQMKAAYTQNDFLSYLQLKARLMLWKHNPKGFELY